MADYKFDIYPGDDAFSTFNAVHRQIKEIKSGEVTVTIHGGNYLFNKTFEIKKNDYSEDVKVVFKASEEETPVFIGGHLLDISKFKGITSKEILNRLSPDAAHKIVEYDLKADGIHDYGSITKAGLDFPENPSPMQVYSTHMQLFCNSKVQTLSRYPKEGYIYYGDVINQGTDTEPTTFEYTNCRVENWELDDVWMYGFWRWDFDLFSTKLLAIDVQNKRMSIDKMPRYEMNSGKRYYYFNVLEELSQTGEYYIDRQSGILYFYPPEGGIESAMVSSLDTPVILLSGASNVSFQGIDIIATRGSGVVVDNCECCSVSNCNIIGTGVNGVVVNSGKNNRIENCEIAFCGYGGVILSGTNNRMQNCHIHDFSKIRQCYAPGVQLEGMGNYVSGCHMHNAPSHAICFIGNDHVIEDCELYNVCTEVNDASAIYTYNNYTWMGNIIRRNYIHDIYAASKETAWGVQAAAVYFDNFISGNTVCDNVFENLDEGVFIHGGRSNQIYRNMFVNCTQSTRIGKIGHPPPVETLSMDDEMRKELERKYPAFSTVYDEEYCFPKYNAVYENIVCNSGTIGILHEIEETLTLRDNKYISIVDGKLVYDKNKYTYLTYPD